MTKPDDDGPTVQLPLIHDYGSFVAAMVARRQQLGLSQLALDDLTGWPSGYTGKLESWQGPQGRVAGRVSMPLWFSALGVRLIPVVTSPVAPANGHNHKLSGADMARRIPEDRRPRPDRERRLPEGERSIARAGR